MIPLLAQKPSDIAVDVVIPVLNEAHVLAGSVARLRQYLLSSIPYRWRER